VPHYKIENSDDEQEEENGHGKTGALSYISHSSDLIVCVCVCVCVCVWFLFNAVIIRPKPRLPNLFLLYLQHLEKSWVNCILPVSTF
jgi:hypothetical protein